MRFYRKLYVIKLLNYINIFINFVIDTVMVIKDQDKS